MTNAIETGYYRIGAVARMTGIALPTLRMWERRYNIVEPLRTDAGGRLYTREHVARLALLQAAVQAGHAIGTVAKLSDSEIQKRLRDTLPQLAQDSEAARLAVIGETLPTLMAGPEGADPTLELVSAFNSVSAAEALNADDRIDVLVLELPTLHPDDVERLVRLIERVGARFTVAVYGFTSRRILRRLDLLNVLCIRAPADLTQLVRICRLAASRADGGGPRLAEPAPALNAIPERIYSDRELLQLATLDSALMCGCPQHVAALISSLSAFERYSLECESKSSEDAAIHALLHRASAQSRHIMEAALQELLKTEPDVVAAVRLTPVAA
jgi:MerR family transcriptional regulator, light-induced transcriptional regulator